MKQSNALAYLRQICCSGLNSQWVIPEFLRALHQLIPTGRNWYGAIDEQFRYLWQVPDYFIPEFVTMTDMQAVVYREFFTQEIMSQYAAWHKQHLFMANEHICGAIPAFYDSDIYNLLHRPLDQHHMLEARVVWQGRIVGLLALTRPKSLPSFTAQEQALCVQLTPYIAHALQAPVDETPAYLDSGQSGLMIMDEEGTIQYLSDAAERLLMLSQHPMINFDSQPATDPVIANLQQLCRNLNAIFQNKSVAPPSWSHTNAHGRFLFRAYWLNKQNQEPGGLIGMNIELQVPLLIKVLRALQNLPLSPMQKEVAAMIAQGFSNDKIGQRLHIKLTTVKDHIRKIFVKLDIQQREELLPKLLAMDQAIGQPGAGRILNKP